MDKLISKKILELLKRDQENIKNFYDKKTSLEGMKKTSKELSEEFKKIILSEGFPFKNIVSNDVYKAGIALSLHLPTKDLKNIFKKIEKASNKEVDSEHKAFFIDKIKVAENKPQVYGTQIIRKENGEIELLETEDKENINKRREELGLESLEDYLKKFSD